MRRPIDDVRLRQLATLVPHVGLDADSAAEIRALASEVIMHRGEQFARAELVVALGEALGIAAVPEYNPTRKRLAQICERHERACEPAALEQARSAS